MSVNIAYAKQICKKYGVEPRTYAILHLTRGIDIAKAVLPAAQFKQYVEDEKLDTQQLRDKYNVGDPHELDSGYDEELD